MVTLPKEFVATKYPGYFWNVKDERLYSVKVSGMLKPLAKGRRWTYTGPYGTDVGYNVSINGRKRFLILDDLKKLTPKKSVWPVYEQLEMDLK